MRRLEALYREDPELGTERLCRGTVRRQEPTPRAGRQDRTEGRRMNERDLWTPTTPANPAAKARKCVRHRWYTGSLGEGYPETVICMLCGKVRDESKSRQGRNSRKRGGAEELVVALLQRAGTVQVQKPSWA